MSRIKTALLVLFSCAVTSLVTAALVLYMDVKPGVNTFAEAGGIVYSINDVKHDDENVNAVPTGIAVYEEVGATEKIDGAASVVAESVQDNETVTAAENDGTSDSVYYRIPGRDKYHVAECRYVKGKENIERIDDAEIIAGLSACKVCVKE